MSPFAIASVHGVFRHGVFLQASGHGVFFIASLVMASLVMVSFFIASYEGAVRHQNTDGQKAVILLMANSFVND
jgi:hypothetical protein